MNYLVLDKNFETIGIIDKFESLIWNKKFKDAGDFELYTPVTDELLNIAVLENYLFSDIFYDESTDKADLMIIEKIEITSDPNNGNKIKVTGESLKSLLKRRIIWKQTVVDKDTDAQTAIKKLVTENMLNPEMSERKMNNFVWIDKTSDWGTLDEDLQLEGENLYDAVLDICEKCNAGFQVVVNFTTGKFEMSMIQPAVRTYSQLDYPPVVFSPGFENILNSNYVEHIEDYKNVALVYGEGDEYNRLSVIVGEASGMDRREMFVSASDLSQEKEDGTIYGTTTYKSMLRNRGQTELNANKRVEVYEGEAASNQGYEFGEDYEVGDVVEIINDFGMSAEVRVSEVVLSENVNGITIVPSFEAIEEESS